MSGQLICRKIRIRLMVPTIVREVKVDLRESRSSCISISSSAFLI